MLQSNIKDMFHTLAVTGGLIASNIIIIFLAAAGAECRPHLRLPVAIGTSLWAGGTVIASAIILGPPPGAPASLLFAALLASAALASFVGMKVLSTERP